MATIRKRGPYQWQAEITRRGFPRLAKTFTVRSRAEAWAKQIESEIERGVWVSRTEAEKTTFGECLDRYLREIIKNKKGRAQEESTIRHFKSLPLSERFMASIRSADIAEWRDSRLQEAKAATVVRQLALLSHLFNTARREWGMESVTNPVGLVGKPKLGRGRTRRLLAGELDALLDAASDSTELPAIICLAIETGMRRGEIASLRWENVRLKEKHLLLPDTKNGDARQVPLSTMAIKTLKALPRSLHGPVFSIRADSMTQAFNRARRRGRKRYENACVARGETPDKTFLVDLRFHDQRHEAASRLFEKGLSIMEAGAITGHRDLRSLKRYTHLKVQDLAEKLG